ncbi:MAG: putative hemagglutinin-related protein, partial [Betaproteobacteria bacterium]|nr:putative hemagglutinin-related protein [Betaproteobacteria bacterium]
MNRNLYRIVFNKARGLLMAVAETARTQTKGASRADGVTRTRKLHFARLKLAAFATQLAFGATALMIPLAHAQIVPDRAAPANQRPSVLNAANGVPQVNIQTPSAAGVSRNTYSQFDVEARGAILNNARAAVQTQLGGWIEGNPSLAGGTARLILNEVNSSSASLLRGFVEVGGDRAQVVIANPSGVTCNGCGFINANRATLTTGTPIMNGGNLEGYLVQRGVVSVQGAGLDASRTDFTDIIARAVVVNAGIWASNLRVTAGANRVNVDHTQVVPVAGIGPAPAFAIDVAQLGGMYAGKITLIGTEAGVGVRHAGEIGASAGEVVITANGRLESSGRLTSTANARIDTTGGISHSGILYAQGDAILTTRGNVDNGGAIAAQGNTTIAATGAASTLDSTAGSVLGAGIFADGSVGSSGTLALSATQSARASGQNLAGGTFSAIAAAVSLAGSDTRAQNLSFTATAGDLDASRATLAATHGLTATVAQTLRTDGARASASAIDITARDLSNQSGEVSARDNLHVAFSGALDNTAGLLAAQRDVTLTGGRVDNTRGTIAALGALDVQSGALMNDGGLV